MSVKPLTPERIVDDWLDLFTDRLDMTRTAHSELVERIRSAVVAAEERIRAEEREILNHVLTYGLVAHRPKHRGPSNCTACGIEAWLKEQGVAMPGVAPSAAIRAGTPEGKEGGR